MPTDYRALYNQYAQGMQQPGTVARQGSQASQPGAFNFLQGWTASPHAGYLPPNQNSYGSPITGNQIGPYAPQQGSGMGAGAGSGGGMGTGGGMNSTPGMGGYEQQYQGGNIGVPRLPHGPERNQAYQNTLQQWFAQQLQRAQQGIAPPPNLQAPQDTSGKPFLLDQINPGANVNNPWGG